MDTVLATMRRGVPLPYDAEVEWLGGSLGATDMIKLPKLTSKNATCSIEARIEYVPSGAERDFFGCYSALFLVGCFSRFVFHYYPRIDASPKTETQKSVIMIEAAGKTRKLVVDNIVIGTATSNVFSDADMYLFNAGANRFPSDMKCEWVKETQDGNLIFDAIPVRFTNELGVSEGAMYDRVSGQLFRNQGTGAFAVGPDKQTYTQSLGVLMPQKDAEPTARDYVQDGLVAMWDGIENAGWGVHDQNATVWKDLVGGLEASPLLQSVEFGSDYAHITRQNRLSCTSEVVKEALSGDGITAEVCCVFNTYRQPDCVFSINGTGRPLWIFQQSNNYGIAYRQSSLQTVVECDTQSRHTITVSKGNYFVNAVLKGSRVSTTPQYTGNLISIGGMSYNYTNTMPDANVYCIRLYSRALTPAEISHNYAIDKARFKLT